MLVLLQPDLLHIYSVFIYWCYYSLMCYMISVLLYFGVTTAGHVNGVIIRWCYYGLMYYMLIVLLYVGFATARCVI